MGLVQRRISEYVTRHPQTTGARDSHNKPVTGWGPDEQIGIFGFDPGSSTVVQPGREAVVTTPTLYGPFGMPFKHGDACTVRGELYLVEGEPAAWKHPRYGEIGTVVHLRRADG
ncbi:hypothetical protein [Leucobacter sp. Ag1]|uniref:hypothetical protein n=1 Tax=Leucobacter sp. Ag1 TaxID=1642040 RepID=UPI000A54FBB1|nr:hypothetical protein [Leucobacter sp. Ag1]